VSGYVLRDAADDEPAEASTRVCADEDHVDRLSFGGGDDRLARTPGPNQELDLQPGVPAAFDELLGDGFAAVTDLIDADAKASTGKDEIVRVDHAHDQQRGVIPARELERPFRREVRGGRQVGRQQDPPQRTRERRAVVCTVRRRHDEECRGAATTCEVTFGPISRAACTGVRTDCLVRWAAMTETAGDAALSPLDATGRAAVQALSDAIGGIAGVLAVDDVLQLIVDRVRALVGARYAALGILADDRRRIERFITSGITPEQRQLLGDPPEGHGLLGLIITEGRSLRIPDIPAHAASYGFPANHPTMTTLLGVPVRLKNRTIGNLYLTDKIDAGEFSEDDQRLVELFAAHAGIAIENARLHEAVQHLAVVDERERIGKDLHDGIIQSLYGISLSLEDVPEIMVDDADEAAARVDRAIDSLNAAIADLRQFVVGLRPEHVDRTDFIGLLATLADQVRRDGVIGVDLDLPAERIDLPAHARGEILQITREALSNTARHAHASSALVSLRRADGSLRLELSDDGSGFDTSVGSPAGHHGLANMRDRAEALGGTFELQSGSTGTTIIVNVPLVADGDAGGHVHGADA